MGTQPGAFFVPEKPVRMGLAKSCGPDKSGGMETSASAPPKDITFMLALQTVFHEASGSHEHSATDKKQPRRAAGEFMRLHLRQDLSGALRRCL